MAEAVAGWLVSPVIKIVVEKARRCASDRVKWLTDGVSKALERLHNTLVQVQTVACSVEGRRQRQSSPDATSGDLVGAWLQKLKDAIFDADDVLDDFADSAPHPAESPVARATKRIFGANERVNALKEVSKKLEDVRANCPLLLAAAAAETSAPDTAALAAAPRARRATRSSQCSGATGSCGRWWPGSSAAPAAPSRRPSPSPPSWATAGWGRPRWRSCS